MNRRQFFATSVLGLIAAKLGIKAEPKYGLRSEVNIYNPYVPNVYATQSIPFYTNEILLQDEQVIQDILNIRMEDAAQYARQIFAEALISRDAAL